MLLAEARGRFLYEVRPDLFPVDFLCDDEIDLWIMLQDSRKKPHG